jgi:hypothetical protein
LAEVIGLIAARSHLAKWHLIPDDPWQPELEKPCESETRSSLWFNTPGG